jgi:hypothetical protein
MRQVAAGLVLMTSAFWLAAFCSADEPQFALQVFPILKRRCLECHGAGLQESGLRLDDGKSLRTTKVVTGGQPQHSDE